MDQNNPGKYLKYAIGEIILVVIGILIALAINDWNSKRIDQINIKEYYKKIIVEIDDNLAYFDRQISNREDFKKDALKALRILKLESKDSLQDIIKYVGVVRNINSNNVEFPIINEFLAQNYLSKIQNDTIKALFSEFNYQVNFIDLVDAYTITQYQTSIEPFFIKNFNYFDIAYDDFEDIRIEGGPSNKYDELKNNLELWNLISIKLETWEYEKSNLKLGRNILVDLKAEILKDLN